MSIKQKDRKPRKVKRRKEEGTQLFHLDVDKRKPKRLRTKYLKQYFLPSDKHDFIGRMFDIDMVFSYSFASYDALVKHRDCKYAYHIHDALCGLVRRVESLNLVSSMLWPDNLPKSFEDFPLSRYSWLMVTADVFLMRYISVVDCALLFVNEVYDTQLKPQQCSIKNMERKGVSSDVMNVLRALFAQQGDLRDERNSRFHHGFERGFTQDDQTLRMVSQFESWGNSMSGVDRFGRKINIERFFNEALVEFQREFKSVSRQLVSTLNDLYDALGREFEDRFAPLYEQANHGLNLHKRV